MKKNPHIGSSFDDFLDEQDLLADTSLAAIKRVIAWQVIQAMEREDLTKVEMARRMETSRAALDRLLDPDNHSITLRTLDRAAAVLGKRLRFELVDAA